MVKVHHRELKSGSVNKNWNRVFINLLTIKMEHNLGTFIRKLAAEIKFDDKTTRMHMYDSLNIKTHTRARSQIL